jgi:mRNA interferase MazF
MAWRAAAVVPTSTRARPAVFRTWDRVGRSADPFLVDQVRGIDVQLIDGEPIFFLHRNELEEVEVAVTRYLGL